MNDMTQKFVSKSFELHDWIEARLDGLQLPRTSRASLSISCHDLVIEHHLGVAVLTRAKIYGSAFALVRSLFETFVRGVWLRHCATDSEIQKYQADKLSLSFGQLVSAVETVPGFDDGILSGLKENSWSAMNSYTHGGALQSGRRFSGECVEPNYDVEEVAEVIRLTGTFAIMAFQQIAIEAGRLDLVNEAIERISPVKSQWVSKF
ncbi:hypothetical protein MARHY3713 [Marinobacter nauticus ATCC 49840]|uniref:DUF6988 family protein n=1 Tax=Marinobacter nauticus TaxID=2743 RepID=UPI000256EA5F|nr:hypothetical protein [Marinobacter nauticus]CCG97167.1 hypothetical protein MARHY3713 [Marinobacter nauticus ATCC 49840]